MPPVIQAGTPSAFKGGRECRMTFVAMNETGTTKPQSLESNQCAAQTGRLRLRAQDAFTLIELLAVVVVIAMLAAILLGTINAVRLKADRSQTRVDIAMLSLAIENYKLDHGTYPTSSLVRISSIWYSSGQKRWATAEINNSGLLLAQLAGAAKKYYNFRKDQTNTLSAASPTNGPAWATMNVIVDRWGSPLNYFCTYPTIPTPIYWSYNYGGGTLYCSTGGQMNVSSFDLWSYGPDNVTYLPISGADWNTPSYAADDITNWKR